MAKRKDLRTHFASREVDSPYQRTDLSVSTATHTCIMESHPLKNVPRENANKLEKRKRACVTSRRPVNPTVNHVISRVCRIHKYFFLLRQPKRSAIHRWRIDISSIVILIRLCSLNYLLMSGFLLKCGRFTRFDHQFHLESKITLHKYSFLARYCVHFPVTRR